MNFSFYLEKLEQSEEFKRFFEQNKDAYLCSGFFSIDKAGQDNQQHIDFYVPSSKDISSFQLEKDFELLPMKNYGDTIPEKIEPHFDFNLNEIERMLLKRMEEENIKNKLQKILFSFQKVNGKGLIILTAFISNMGIIKASIDISSKEFIDFEKKSFFDMLNFVGKKK